MVIESKYTAISWEQPGKGRGGGKRGANTSKLGVGSLRGNAKETTWNVYLANRVMPPANEV